MKYHAVLFDFDYTLGDATGAIVAGFQYAFARMGLPLPEPEVVRLTVGHTLEDSYTQLSGDALPARQAQFCRLYREKAAPLQVRSTRLFPGAAELLAALHAAGIPAGIVSSKGAPLLREVLRALGVAHFLCSVTGGDQVSRPKPDPEGLLRATAALELAPEQVLFCGDTVIDASAAQQAGCGFCAVLNGTTGADAFAAYPHVHIAPSVWELKDLLDL